ncbi:MAG TPA: group 1 truncated hemoglobin [Azospirillum sp.]|nr:group 1 truncated hemoglobin [Azospirillum sp.]
MNRQSRWLALAVLVPLAGGLVACNTPEATSLSQASEKPLYDRLGGKPAITAVVDQFVANVAADKRINGFFGNTDIPHLKMQLVDQICAGSGGPCTYAGRSMREVHAGMGVTDADFNALVENLVTALDKFNVPAHEKNELLGILGPMKKDIVGV